MKQGYELKIEQSQKLTMTPALLQAINVLQLNTMQLDQYVQERRKSPKPSTGRNTPKAWRTNPCSRTKILRTTPGKRQAAAG